MRKIIFLCLILGFVMTACSKNKKPVDYEGQRNQAEKGQRSLEKE